MINAVLNQETGEMMEYRQVMKNPKYRAMYEKACAKGIGRLAQGMPGLAGGTETIFFIDKGEVPPDRWRDVTYGRIVVSYRPEKYDPYRVRLTVGGDRLTCLWYCSTPTVDMLTVKLLLNSIVSTPNEKFMSIDIKDFYLNTPMPWYEYMQLKLSNLPGDVIRHYKLSNIATKDGHIYI